MGTQRNEATAEIRLLRRSPPQPKHRRNDAHKRRMSKRTDMAHATTTKAKTATTIRCAASKKPVGIAGLAPNGGTQVAGFIARRMMMMMAGVVLGVIAASAQIQISTAQQPSAESAAAVFEAVVTEREGGETGDETGVGVPEAVVIWRPQSQDESETIVADAVAAARRETLSGFIAAIRELGTVSGVTDFAGRVRWTWPSEFLGKPGRIYAVAFDTTIGTRPVVAVAAPTGSTPTPVVVAPISAIHLTIRDGETATPIPRAQMIVWATPRPAVSRPLPTLAILERFRDETFRDAPGHGIRTTLRTGRASLAPAADDQFHHLYVRAPGYLPLFVPNIEIPAGKRADIDLDLRRGRPVVGQVVDDHGEPVPFARITATPIDEAGQPEIDNGLHPFVQRAYADIDGHFRIGGWPPMRGLRMGLMIEAIGYDTAFVRADPTANDAGTIRLQKLSTVLMSVTMPDGTRPADFNALDVAIGPIGVVRVPHPIHAMFSSDRAGSFEVVWEDADGRVLGPNGQPDARYARPGTGAMTVRERRRLEAAKNFFDATAPDPGRPDAGVLLNRPPRFGARPKLRLVGLVRGEFTIIAHHSNHPPIQIPPLRIGSAETRRLGEWQFEHGATIAGSVFVPPTTPTDDAPAPHFPSPATASAAVTVIALPMEPAALARVLTAAEWPPADVATATVDAKGQFALPAMRAGDYVIAVMAAGCEPATVPVRVADGTTETITVTLRRAQILRGTVTVGVANAQPVDLRVAVEPLDRPKPVGGVSAVPASVTERVWAEAQTITIEPTTGTFFVAPAEPGRAYRLHVSAAGALSMTVDVPETGRPATGVSGGNGAGSGNERGRFEGNWSLNLKMLGGIEGWISGPHVRAAAGCRVWLQRADGTIVEPTVRVVAIAPDGALRFRIADLLPGPCRVWVGSAECGMAAPVDLVIEADAVATAKLDLPPRHSVPITVRDAITGETIPRAAVTLRPSLHAPYATFLGSRSISTVTDASGRAVLSAPFSALVVHVAAVGYSPSETLVEIALPKPDDADGNGNGDNGVTVALQPTVTVRGRVISAAGHPRPDVTVQLVAPRTNPLNLHVPVRTAPTDATGHFEFADVAHGQWIFVVPPAVLDDDTPATVRAVTIFPNTVAAAGNADAGPMVVSVEIREEPVAALCGRVVGVRRGDDVGAVSILRIGENFVQHRAEVAADGTFVAMLPAGEFLVAHDETGVWWRITMPLVPTVDAPVIERELVLPAGRIFGRLVDPHGQPIHHARVTLQHHHFAMLDTPAAEESDIADPTARLMQRVAIRQTTTDALGQFEFFHVAPSEFRLTATATNGPGNGNSMWASEIATLSAGETRMHTLVARPAGALCVRIFDVPPHLAMSAEVRAIDSTGREWPLHPMPTDASSSNGTDDSAADGDTATNGGRGDARGEFRFVGLPGGWHTVHVQINGRAPMVARIKILPGSRRVAHFTPSASTPVFVVFRTATNDPIGGMPWRLLDERGTDVTPIGSLDSLALGAAAVSDMVGQIELRNLAFSTPYTLEFADASGRHTGRRTVIVTALESAESTGPPIITVTLGASAEQE